MGGHSAGGGEAITGAVIYGRIDAMGNVVIWRADVEA
jgi:hypothetical protein